MLVVLAKQIVSYLARYRKAGVWRVKRAQQPFVNRSCSNPASSPKRIARKYFVSAALLTLLVATFCLVVGIHFRWYTPPYPPFGKSVAWAIGMPEAAYNFATVTPGKLFRSALPDANFIDYVRRRYGVRTVVSLYGPAEFHQTARDFGMQVLVLDWRTKAPSAEEVKTLLEYLNQNNAVLVHCRAGRDRTGLVIALHRMEQQNWPLERALQEMEAYGHAKSRRSATSQALRYLFEEITRSSHS